MKNYTYRFNDGTTNTVEVTDEMFEELAQMDKAEKLNDRAEKRRHISLDCLKDSGIELDEKDRDPLVTIIAENEMEDLRHALSTLSEEQKTLIERVFFNRESVISIARENGVTDMAIFHKLKKIYEKIKKFCE